MFYQSNRRELSNTVLLPRFEFFYEKVVYFMRINAKKKLKMIFNGNPLMKAEFNEIQMEKRLIAQIQGFQSSQIERKIHSLYEITQNTNQETALLVLSFLVELADESVESPAYALRSLNFHISELKRRVACFLPEHLLAILELSAQVEIVEIEEQKFDDDDKIGNLIMESLIQSGTKDIENAISKFYKPKLQMIDNFNRLDLFGEQVISNWTTLKKTKRFFFKALKAKDVEWFIRFLEKTQLLHLSCYCRFILSIVNSMTCSWATF